MLKRRSFPSFSLLLLVSLIGLLAVLFSFPSSEASSAFSSPLKSLQSRFRTLDIPNNCNAPLLNSLSIQSLPFYSSQVIDLDLTPPFEPNAASYFTTRAFSQGTAFLRINLGSTTPASATVTLLLNGKSVDVHPPVPNIDVALVAGTNTVEIDVTNGECTSIYQVLVLQAPLAPGETIITFPNCNTLPLTAFTGFTIGVSAAGSGTVVPLTYTPPYSTSTLPFYVAYEGPTDFTGGNIHFTATFPSADWFRYSINHGTLTYGAASGQEIVAPLVPGTNLIQFDLIEPPPCGNYIAEYSLTIYAGPAPGASVSPCTPLQLSSLNLNEIPWLSNTVIPLPVTLQNGVYDYTLTRSAAHAILQVQATGPAGVAVNVYLNGKIVQPNPVPAGFTLDLVLVAGTDTIRIDLVQGDCISSYTFTILNNSGHNQRCKSPNEQVEITGVTLSVTDAHGHVYPLTITPTWNGLTTWFYVAYIGNHDVTGGHLTFTVTGITPTAWLRYAINHGTNIYGNVIHVPITAPLVTGTNLIQLDALQLYSCGNFIAEYSITVYQGPSPRT